MSDQALSAAAADLTAEEAARLLYGLVIPRPIAWVGSCDPEGRANLAPFSFYTAVSSAPPRVMFSITNPASGIKDTLANLRATGTFTISLVPAALLDPMIESARSVPPEVDEFALAGLTAKPGAAQSAPFVGEAPAAMECRVLQEVAFADAVAVFGEVVHFHLAPGMRVEGRPDAVALDPMARLGGAFYSGLGPVSLHHRR